jgi:nicotinamidase-related amidase
VSGLAITARYRREASGEPQRTIEEQVRVDPVRAALLLVDVYPRTGPHAGIVRTMLAPARAAARAAGIPVVYATNELAAFTTADSQWRQVWIRTLGADVLESWREPTDAFDYLPEIEPGPRELVVRKQHYSAFARTRLDELLRERGIGDLFVAGFDARVCVSATATDALAHDYRVFALRDAIASSDADEGGDALAAAVRYLEVCVGYSVSTADFVAACRR